MHVQEGLIRRLTVGLRWLGMRKTELAVFLLGAALRVTMGISFQPEWAYDAHGHFAVIDWYVKHQAIPAPDVLFHAFHPPLFYTIGALIKSGGGDLESIQWLSIICGILRLALIWAGLELYLKARPARIAALSLVAVLTASVHTDGMVYGEPLSGLLAAVALLMTPLIFQRSPARRWWLASGLGVVLGLSMLTKVSNLVIIASIGFCGLCEVLFKRFEGRQRWSALGSWALVGALCIAVSGWYYARNVRDYGRPFVTSFDLPTDSKTVEAARKKPLLERRSLGYAFGYSADIYRYPYYPASVEPHSNFFSALLAATFNDYWNYSYSGLDPQAPSPMRTPIGRPLTPALLELSRRAVLGGTLIALATACATWFGLRKLLAERNWGLIALVLAPLLVVAAALQFAIANPVDQSGVVKGNYLQFAAPPLYGLFGVAVAWAHEKPIRWPLASLLWLSLWLVAAYSIYCRTRILVIPLPI